MLKVGFSALKLLLWMTLITGIAYPLVVTAMAQLFFSERANGSLIRREGKIIGSEFVAQKFDSPGYFWSRPSAVDSNPLPSGGSNYGWTSTALKEQVDKRRQRLGGGADIKEIPADLLLASGSGLDPQITLAAARWQVARVAQARNFTAEQRQRLEAVIDSLVEAPSLGVLGEYRINVLQLNLALDGI